MIMNNLFNQLMPNGQGNSQFSWLMNMVKGNPQGLANMVQSNPKFNEFVANNKGKSVEQIARENGLDMNMVRYLIGR